MRTTGGLDSAATSTRSRPSSAANHLASSIDLIPICPPSGATRRTSLARILSLTLGSLDEIGTLPVRSFLFRCCPKTKRAAHDAVLPGVRTSAHSSSWLVPGRGRVGSRRLRFVNCEREYTGPDRAGKRRCHIRGERYDLVTTGCAGRGRLRRRRRRLRHPCSRGLSPSARWQLWQNAL